MKYVYKIFEGTCGYREACRFLNDNHIPPERVISLTPVEYYKYRSYGIGDTVTKVVLFYIEE